ncbi:MAG: glucosaminidase domain-containing protein, partial [Bacteroidota bacterium]
MFAPENADRTGLLMMGLGDILRGGSGSNAFDMGMQMNLLKQAEQQEKAERTEGLKLTQGALTSMMGGQSPNLPAYSSPDPNSPAGIGADTMAALGKSSFTPGDRDSFVTAMLPYAREAAKTTGLDPRLIVAQSALETGYGRSAPGNNFFGIKSHGLPGGNVLATTEFEDGTRLSTKDSFRQYGGMGESVAGYVDFLQSNPRYGNMLAAEGLDAQLAALGQSGYATDPRYAEKVGSIAQSISLEPGAHPSAVLQERFANIPPERAAQIIHHPDVSPAIKSAVLAQFQQQEPPSRTAMQQNAEWLMSQGYSRDEAIRMARGGGGSQFSRFKVVGNQLYDLSTEGGPTVVGSSQHTPGFSVTTSDGTTVTHGWQ